MNPEALIPPGEKVRARMISSTIRKLDMAPVHLLQTVLQHRPIHLLEQLVGNADLEVGCYAEHILVVGGVVDLA